MTSKERIHALLAGEIPDRIGKADAPWPETRARWHTEGMPADVHANDFFEMDLRHMLRVDTSFALEETLEDETDDSRTIRTSEGVLTKFWTGTGAPQMIEYALKDRDDWNRLRERLVPSRDRFSWGYYGDYGHEYVAGDFAKVKAAYDACPTRDETYLVASFADPYENFMAKMGDEALLVAMVTEPEWVGGMFDAHVAFCREMTDLLVSEFRVDGVFIGGDLAYKNGMLFSPKTYRDLVMPRHAAMISHFKSHGLQVIYHCDGDCREAVPMLIEAGIDCLQPLEVKAGLDVRQLAETYGDRIAFMGNLDVVAMSAGGPALEEEVTAKVRAMTSGRFRFIAHSDHSVPDTVSFANYRRVVEIIDDLGGY